MTTEYISRQAAINIVCSDDCEDCPDGGCDLYRSLRRLPAADVRPVVKAEWIECYNPYDRAIWIKCSACSGWGSFTNEGYNHRSFFCPNCGADMREVQTDG